MPPIQVSGRAPIRLESVDCARLGPISSTVESSRTTDDEVHEPEFSGTTTEAWDDPQLEDFSTDDPSEVAEHFVLSASGFPPENFTDLKLPVVDPDGDLNKNALATAKGGGRGVGAIEGLDDETTAEIEELIDELANEHFEDADFGDRSSSGDLRRGRTTL